jgi:hypothetical protein
MTRFVLVLLTAVTAINTAPAQTLAHTAPADTVAYFRSWSGDPMKAMEKMMSGGGMWENPIDMDSLIEMMDEGMDQLGSLIGVEAGSIGSYLRSINGYEGALYRFAVLDGFPELDFVIVIETAMAEQIYKLLSGKLIEEALADDMGNDEVEVNVDEFSMNIARRDNKIIIASDSARLNETMSKFGSVVAGSLAQSRHFKTAVGSDSVPDYCVYIDTRPILRFADEMMPATGRFDPARTIMTSLGIWKLAALGWTETETYTHLAVVGDGTIPAFEILDCGKGGHAALDIMPADTVFGFAWNGHGPTLWKKASALILDRDKFPMAPLVEEQLRGFQQMTGLKIEELAELAAGGGSFTFMPDEDGRLDDDPENFVGTLVAGESAQAQSVVEKLLATMVERRGGKVESTVDGDETWYRVTEMERMRDVPTLLLTGNSILVGAESSLRRALAARAGQAPTLAKFDVTKGLPKEASAYMFVGLKPFFASEREFAAAYANTRDGAGVAAAVTIAADRIVVRTSRPLTMIVASVGTASAMRESQRREGQAVMKDLEKIAEAYREFRGKNNRDPRSLSELGFTGDKALAYPPNRPANTPGKAYVLVSTEGADLANGSDVPVVTCPDSKYGRLVGTIEGKSASWSETRYAEALKKQKLVK